MSDMLLLGIELCIIVKIMQYGQCVSLHSFDKNEVDILFLIFRDTPNCCVI